MIYTYETTGKGRKKTYEIQQGMSDAPLTKHPQTKEPIKRVITGGSGFSKTSCKNVQKLRIEDCKQSKHYNPNKRLTVAPGGI